LSREIIILVINNNLMALIIGLVVLFYNLHSSSELGKLYAP